MKSLSRVRLFATPRTVACQALPSMGFSRQEYWSGVPLPSPILTQSLVKFISIELVMPSNHFILCCPLLLLPSTFPSIRVFSIELTLCIRWPAYWSFCFSISASNEYSGFISFRIDWLISLQSKGLSRVFPNTKVQKHQFFGAQLSSQSNSHIHK